MKLSGKNFQSWPEFDLDIDGLTIVIGPSNEGKSNLIRALRGVLRNELDADYIRNPKDQPLELTVETAGHTIFATRSKKGSVKYNINGEPFAKLDGDIPEVIRNLKFGEVRIGDFTIDPIFAEQNSSQFLIDPTAYKPSMVNAVLGAFGGTEKLEGGKKEANLRKTQKDSEARLLAGQIREAEEHKAQLTVFLGTGEKVDETLQTLGQKITSLEHEARWSAEAHNCRRLLRPLHQIIEALVLPDISGIEILQQVVVFTGQAGHSTQYAQWLHRPLKAVNQTTESWLLIVPLWKKIRALATAIALPPLEAELQSFAGLNIRCNEALMAQSSIGYLDTVVKQRRKLKASADQLVEIDEQLAVAQEETRRGLCEVCGKPLEHICIGRDDLG
jgi:hypothetical protein